MVDEPFSQIHRVPAVCSEPGCQATWQANSFLPPPADGSPIKALCGDCERLLDARLKAWSAKYPKTEKEIHRARHRMVRPTETEE